MKRFSLLLWLCFISVVSMTIAPEVVKLAGFTEGIYWVIEPEVPGKPETATETRPKPVRVNPGKILKKMVLDEIERISR